MQEQVKVLQLRCKKLVILQHKAFIYPSSKITKLQHKDSGFCHKTLSLLVGFGHETGRQQN